MKTITKLTWERPTTKEVESLKTFITENYTNKVNGKTNTFTITYKYLPTGEISTIRKRLFISNEGSICYFKKGSSRHGYPLETFNRTILKVEVNNPIKNEEEEFIKNCNKVLKHLEVNNLWEKIKIETLIMKACGYSLSKEMHDKMWNSSSYRLKDKINNTIIEYVKSLNNKEILSEEEKAHIESIPFTILTQYFNEIENDFQKVQYYIKKSGDAKLYKYFLEKHGTETLTEEYIKQAYSGTIQETLLKHFIGETIRNPYNLFSDFYMIDNPKIKKMSFHKNKYCKYITETKLSEIANAIQNKQEYRTTGRNGYDVTFSYNPNLNQAWYSEEYKDCGNGHYYLALNSTHAIFCEDD